MYLNPFKGIICNISALKCLKRSRPILYSLLSCVFTLSIIILSLTLLYFQQWLYPDTFVILFKVTAFHLITFQWRHIL